MGSGLLEGWYVARSSMYLLICPGWFVGQDRGALHFIFFSGRNLAAGVFGFCSQIENSIARNLKDAISGCSLARNKWRGRSCAYHQTDITSEPQNYRPATKRTELFRA
jgi:hypothetical protein